MKSSLQKAFTLVEILVVVSILAILMGLIGSAVGGARAKANSLACMNNLRQLGMSFHMYAEANQGYFPFPNASYGSGSGKNYQLCWFNALDPYLLGIIAANNKSSEIVHLIKQDPIIKSLGALWLTNAHTIKMNSWLTRDTSGTKGSESFWSLDDFPDPSLTVLLFDGKAETIKDSKGLPESTAINTDGTEGDVMRRHSDQANILFVDGHVELRNEKHQNSGTGGGWKVNETRLIWKPWSMPDSD